MNPLLLVSPLRRCPSGCQTRYVRRGHYRRESDLKIIQRYQCRGCDGSFSEATNDHCYGQKRRDVNVPIFRSITGCMSQRRIARDLRVNRKTVARKFLFLGLWAKKLLPEVNRRFAKAKIIEFDDLETSEHTKCKPLSVIVAVEFPTRRLLVYGVAKMPAKGRLSAISKKKYGPRKDERRKKRRELFEDLKDLFEPDAIIKSDKNPHYIDDVKEHFPKATHRSFKGQRGSDTGQGELKQPRFDPIFAINHTNAMLRANINRLIRKTWCTTKKQECLDLHIAIYALRHNLDLIQKTH